MDARELIQLENRVLGEVRKLLNAKFQNGNEELSTDSKLAVQQLNTAVSALRDELAKTNSSFRVISVTVDDVNQRINILGTELKDARTHKDINDLKVSVDKLWDQVLAADTGNRLGVLEKAIADVVNRVGTIERTVNMPVKRNPAEVHATNVDHAALQDVTARIGDVLSQLQGVKLDVDNVQKQIAVVGSLSTSTPTISDEDFTSLKDRLIKLELTIASLTTAMIDSETTRNEVQQAEIELLKARLDHADKRYNELESKIKGLTTQINAAPAQTTAPAQIPAVTPPVVQAPIYDPQVQVASPAPAQAVAPQAAPIAVQPPVKVAVAQPVGQSPTPIIQSAFSPFAFGLK